MDVNDAGDPRLSVLIVTGFLGSGKTTLLRDALGEAPFRRSLVLVNEAAGLGVDDRLLRSVAGHEVRLLASGCLCCKVQEDLKRTLLAIVDDKPVMEQIDRVVIETSGLADPVSAIATLAAHPRLAGQLRLQSVVTVVDVLNAEEQARESPEFATQVQCADTLVLAKTDLATRERIEEIVALLDMLNPMAERLDVSRGAFLELAHLSSRFPSDRLRDPPALPAPAMDERGIVRRQERLAAIPTRSTLRHTDNVSAFAITMNETIDWIDFSTWFSLLIHAHGSRLLRIKGMLAVGVDEAPVVINTVRHVVHFPEHLAQWPDEDRVSHLVFVVRDLAAVDIERSMRAFVGAGVRLHAVGPSSGR